MNTATLSRAGNLGLTVGIAGAIVTGAIVIWRLVSEGHATYNTSSSGLMWGLPIVTYDFMLMSSCGAALMASMWTVLGVRDFEPIARRALWLALALAVGGIAALFLELGSPLRSLYAIPLNLQVKAPLFWKALGIGVYVVCLVLMAAGWLAKPAADTKPGRGVALLGAIAALIVIAAGALMFATLSMRPFWFSGEVPAMVLVEALLGGLAFTLLLTHLGGHEPSVRAVLAGSLPRWVAGLTFLTLVFVAGRAIVGLASNLDGMQVWQAVTASATFWIQVAFLVAALWLTSSSAMRGSGSMQMVAAALLIVALFIGKYEFVIGGQLVPLFKGSWVHGLIAYTPSASEWLLLAMAAFVAYAVYAFGASRFRLGADG